MTKTTKESKNEKRFRQLEDGWVRDSVLGLEWGPSSGECMNLEEAEKYCTEQCGRLPAITELITLIDYKKTKPAIDTDFFADTNTDDWYWTDTKVAGLSNSVWCVYFYYGNVNNNHKGTTNFVRPVRIIQ